MKNKHGFTLIELLAVIVIFGIILSIACVGLIDIIEKSKANAFRISAGNIYDSATKEIEMTESANRFYFINEKSYNKDDKTLSFDGEKPDFGVVDTNLDGNTAIAVYNGIYCATQAGDEKKVTIEAIAIEDCKTYNIIETDSSWTNIGIEYEVDLQELLDLNEETDVNSSTVGRKIKVPINIITDENLLVKEEGDLIYHSRTTTYNYVDGATQLTLSDDDEGTGYIDLGFNFNFGGTNGYIYNEIYVISNGYIIFANSETDYDNKSVSSLQFPTIMPYWDDLVFSTSTSPNAGVYYTIGNESGKKFILVEWREVNDYNTSTIDDTTVGSFEVKLYEDGLIKCYYKDVDFDGSSYKNGLSSTLGVFVNENNYNEYSYNSESIVDGSAIEYYLAPGTVPQVPCFTFDTANKEITDYRSDKAYCSTDVVIPSSINEVAVENIDVEAFDSKGITSVSIPNTVIYIGTNAFQNNLLTSVVIPNSVTSMSSGVFFNNKLTSVTIGSGLSSIMDYTFRSNLLTSIAIPANVTDIGGLAFSENKFTSFVLPSTVVSIGKGILANNPTLAAITMGAGFSTYFSVSNNAIYDKTGSDLIMGTKNSATSMLSTTSRITSCAYDGMGVVSVTLPSNVVYINDCAFCNNSITTLSIGTNVRDISSNAFLDNKISSLTIANGVTSIRGSAFSNNSLTTVTIPNSVTMVDSYAFSDNYITQGFAKIDRASGSLVIYPDAFSNNGPTKTTTITPTYLR